MSKLPPNDRADPGSPPTKGKAAASPAPLIPIVAADKLAYQDGHGALSAAEAALRVARLQADARRTSSARGPRQSGGIFEASCASDVLFLLDATLSMADLIGAVKRQVRDILYEIEATFYRQADVRLAVVAYRDHESPDPYEWIDFTRDADAVFSFLDTLRTQQSTDTCEDVVGGLDKALQLAWQNPTRCIMHIGDAPAHGRANHHFNRHHDHYCDADKTPEPHGLTLGAVCDRMIAARINYVFFRIAKDTDLMLYNMFTHYYTAAPGARLSPLSTYSIKAQMDTLALQNARRRRRGAAGHQADDDSIASGLHFEEVDLGSAYNAVARLVVRGVVASSSRTAVRLSTSLSTGRARGLRTKQAQKVAALGAVAEDVPTDAFPPAVEKEVAKPPPAVEKEISKPPPAVEKEIAKPPPAVEKEIAKPPPTVEKKVAKPSGGGGGGGRGGSGGTATTNVSDATLVADRADGDIEDDDGSWERHAVAVEDGPPQWDDEGWLDQRLRVRAFSPDVVGLRPVGEGDDYGGARTLLDRMMESDENIPISTTDLTILRRSQPFAQGALRTVSYARTEASTNPLVVKAFKTPKQLADLVEDMRMQALAKAFALEFNALVGEDQYALDFVTVTCLEPVAVLDGPAVARPNECLLLEPLLPTNDSAYTKYNNNCGGVSSLESEAHPVGKAASGRPASWMTRYAMMRRAPIQELALRQTLDKAKQAWSGTAAGAAAVAAAAAPSAAAQAFSHYTFERSRGRLLVVDLQGVGRVLTDPVVHTRDPARFALSDTNLNADGFKLFFATHRCNALCDRLVLRDGPSVGLGLCRPAGADAFDQGAKWIFRTDWTGGRSGSTAVCCANKLCGRLVPRAAAAAHTGPPGFVWCDGCWPQLAATATTRTCAVATGGGGAAPHTPHTFSVSAFFFESQGQVLPDACAAHGGVVVDAAQFAAVPRSSLLGRFRGWKER